MYIPYIPSCTVIESSNEDVFIRPRLLVVEKGPGVVKVGILDSSGKIDRR